MTGKITLADDSQVNVDADTLTLSSPIVGGFALSKGGTGTLVLSASNSFTGGLTVLAGTLSVGTVGNTNTAGTTGGNLGAGTLPVVLGDDGSGTAATLLYTGGSAASNHPFTMAGGGGTFAVSSSLGLSGVIDGDGGLTKAAGGILTLAASNLYTGPTTVSGGTLAIGTSGSVNDTSGIAVNQGATLQVTAGSSANQLPDTANVVLSGGNLSYTGSGNVSGESVGALVLNPGQNTITTSCTGTGSAPFLRFASGPGRT